MCETRETQKGHPMLPCCLQATVTQLKVVSFAYFR
jgi:hypothetical protein